ncbi:MULTISPECIES: isochorismatase family protein [unclassified Ligilactobacillus]|uniref:isochorismatase family protein n=1 Tax=unclassified Ligilactobacillus TaxID=2767920 RepID=UPI003852DA72
MGRALLVIDMQNGVCTQELYNQKKVTMAVNNRIHEFRKQRGPIVFIQHNDEELVTGTKKWQITPLIDYCADKDITVQKYHADSFYQTELTKTLAGLNVTELEITGLCVEYCVDTTIRVAHDLGYSLTMYKGTTSTYDNEFLSAEKMLAYYYQMWDNRFLTLRDN